MCANEFKRVCTSRHTILWQYRHLYVQHIGTYPVVARFEVKAFDGFDADVVGSNPADRMGVCDRISVLCCSV
jgi:hypothetical protein